MATSKLPISRTRRQSIASGDAIDSAGTARQGRHGEAGLGLTRPGGARQAGLGSAPHGTARLDAARPGMTGDGELAEQLLDLRGKIPAPTEVIFEPTTKLTITPPKMRTAILRIKGTAPYVQHKFSEKAQRQMEETQRAGTQARSRKKREARNFEEGYEAAKHRAIEGWCGIPAPAFRNACIDACRLVGFKMTHAKLALFIRADGRDDEGMPLVKIIGEPRIHKGFARNASGVADLRWRPMWEEWSAIVRIEWDEDQFTAVDVFNLMSRAGIQCGIGEGRPSSPNSNGLGWGTFAIVNE